MSTVNPEIMEQRSEQIDTILSEVDRLLDTDQNRMHQYGRHKQITLDDGTPLELHQHVECGRVIRGNVIHGSQILPLVDDLTDGTWFDNNVVRNSPFTTLSFSAYVSSGTESNPGEERSFSIPNGLSGPSKNELLENLYDPRDNSKWREDMPGYTERKADLIEWVLAGLRDAPEILYSDIWLNPRYYHATPEGLDSEFQIMDVGKTHMLSRQYDEEPDLFTRIMLIRHTGDGWQHVQLGIANGTCSAYEDFADVSEGHPEASNYALSCAINGIRKILE